MNWGGFAGPPIILGPVGCCNGSWMLVAEAEAGVFSLEERGGGGGLFPISSCSSPILFPSSLQGPESLLNWGCDRL